MDISTFDQDYQLALFMARAALPDDGNAQAFLALSVADRLRWLERKRENDRIHQQLRQEKK
jgi:hypothetical protein